LEIASDSLASTEGVSEEAYNEFLLLPRRVGNAKHERDILFSDNSYAYAFANFALGRIAAGQLADLLNAHPAVDVSAEDIARVAHMWYDDYEEHLLRSLENGTSSERSETIENYLAEAESPFSPKIEIALAELLSHKVEENRDVRAQAAWVLVTQAGHKTLERQTLDALVIAGDNKHEIIWRPARQALAATGISTDEVAAEARPEPSGTDTAA